LVDFATFAGPLINADIAVVAASVDTVEQVADLKAGLRVGFPMFAELDAQAVAESTGAYIQTGDRTFLHATSFLLDPAGEVVNSLYSSGPIGRFTASEILRKVLFERSRT
jgi:alkyl hydroperoxide reductase subunit AhpC